MGTSSASGSAYASVSPAARSTLIGSALLTRVPAAVRSQCSGRVGCGRNRRGACTSRWRVCERELPTTPLLGHSVAAHTCNSSTHRQLEGVGMRRPRQQLPLVELTRLSTPARREVLERIGRSTLCTAPILRRCSVHRHSVPRAPHRNHDGRQHGTPRSLAPFFAPTTAAAVLKGTTDAPRSTSPYERSSCHQRKESNTIVSSGPGSTNACTPAAALGRKAAQTLRLSRFWSVNRAVWAPSRLWRGCTASSGLPWLREHA